MPDGSEKSHRLDGVTVNGSAVFNGETTMGGARATGDGGWNVLEFGATGDGTTDDSAAFQKALNASSTTQPRVIVPAGTYKLATGLTSSTANLEIVGVGGAGQDGTIGNGASILSAGSGVVAFTFNPSSASTIFRGPVLRNLMVKDGASGTASGGILLKRTSNFQLHNVVVAGFSGASAYGVQVDGGAGYSQYGQFSDCGFHNCKVGVDLAAATGGHRFVACYFDGNSNAGSPTAGSTGLRVASASGNHGEVQAYGCNFQCYETCVSLGALSENHVLVGCRFEAFTTAVSNSADFVRVLGCSFNNSINGSGGSSVTNAATADRCFFFANHVTSTGNIADSGTNSSFAAFQEGFRPAAGASVSCLPKAGVPADGDFTVTPVSGTLAVDTTNSKLYVRVGSTWKSVTVA